VFSLLRRKAGQFLDGERQTQSKVRQMSYVQQQELSTKQTLKWTRIKFLQHVPDDVTLLPAADMRFCEAVARPFVGDLFHANV